MNRSKKLILSALGVVVIAASTAACAHRHHHSHNPERAKKFVTHRLDHVLDKIDATAAQEAEVHRMKDHLFLEFEAAHAGSKAAHRTILAEWNSDKPDAKKLHALADERVAAYQKAVHEAVDGMVQVHQTLDKGQRQKITEHIEKRMR